MKQTSGYLYFIFQYHISCPYVLFINVVALISGSKERGIHQLNMLLVKLPAHMVPNLSRRCLEFLAYYEPEKLTFPFFRPPSDLTGELDMVKNESISYNMFKGIF